MRIVRPKQAVLMVVSVLALVGCDTTQPDSVGTRNASLSLTARATVHVWNCWEVWEDTNYCSLLTTKECSNDGDCLPTANLGVCTARDGTNVVFRNVDCYDTGGSKQSAVPLNYAMSISMIRAGTTTEEVLGSSIQPGDSIGDFVSMTGFYPPQNGGTAPENSDPFIYRNAKLVTTGSRMYYQYSGHPIDPPYPNVLGRNAPAINADGTQADATFDFSVNSGDTVIVRARKQLVVDVPEGQEIVLEAKLTVSGVAVTPYGILPPLGSVSADGPGDGFSFSYTVP